ncbi:alpha-glucosidase [Paraoerskovia sediminicola]|uniref:Alpha-glucosidase n=1 Tax=Paraoerskovia sediminicola TaxID=1138587 RepID=A0ABN6XE80_9CELL|nr:TIM-barrel domain-containing protein [Paraoerskovia sediminicola]BDZ43243.1 alpha-glucosidase [Paraoerskovia sediminicola]
MFSLSDGSPRPAAAASQITGPGYRFTILTSRLIRLEWADDGAFVDEATAVVTNRDFPVPGFTVERDGASLTVRTEHVELHHDGGPFTSSGLSVTLHGAPDIHYAAWRFGEDLPQYLPRRGNLGGTARTLDEVDGACPLEPGILSTYGFATLDDSASVLMTPDGWVAPRSRSGAGSRSGSGGGAGSRPAHDLYVFAHGHDYQGALDDYFRLTGAPPLVPRHVLGNWWSRFWRYDHDGYLALLDRFDAERLPFSVSVIDMDWHVTDVDPALGTGWTGYTWNRDLFPDPAAFLAALHDRGLAVTLNVHPADGVRRHEDAYPATARALGVDPDSGVAIPFDITDRAFVDAYLDHVHHPLEDEGVDFWWLDWQSGGVTRVPGLDPLWMLNHVHHKDSGRGGRRPLTFSRYSGPGSHRYPVGFSGDTIATWASLDFQPYFTSTAANIGYFWWSHDVGGHMEGSTDPELTARWVQYGVFSPVNRLHSSSSPFGSKEPWLLGREAGHVAARFLRLRHVLVPYLYTAAWAAHEHRVPLARPLYHAYPDEPEAYEHPNVFLFGPDLLVAPITTPRDPEARVGAVTAWLPEGTWTDLFTGATYRGGRTTTLHRGLDDYPVLVRAGAVLPLAADATAPVAQDPDELVLRVVPGTGESSFVEDDGSAAPVARRTVVRQTCRAGEGTGLDLRLEIEPGGPSAAGAGGDAGDSAERDTGERSGRTVPGLGFDLAGVTAVGSVSLTVGGEEHPVTVVETPADDVADLLAPALRLRAEGVDLTLPVVLTVAGARRATVDLLDAVRGLLAGAHIEVTTKDRAYVAARSLTGLELVDELASLGLPAVLLGAVIEAVVAAGEAPSD